MQLGIRPVEKANLITYPKGHHGVTRGSDYIALVSFESDMVLKMTAVLSVPSCIFLLIRKKIAEYYNHHSFRVLARLQWLG
jgi:hypothetical protein